MQLKSVVRISGRFKKSDEYVSSNLWLRNKIIIN